MNKFTKNLMHDGKYGIIIAIIIFILSYLAQDAVANIIDGQIKREFAIHSEEALHEVEDNIKVYPNISASVASLYKTSSFVDREDWSNFINSQELLDKYGGIKALAYVDVVYRHEKNRFIQGVVGEGFENFKIVPEGDRDKYMVVNYVEPFEENKFIFGFDLASNMEVLEALEKAGNTKEFIVTSPINLLQNEGSVDTFLAITPIYINNKPTDTLEQRKENLSGFLLLVFHYDELFGDIIKDTKVEGGIYFSLIDDEQILFESSVNLDEYKLVNDLEYRDKVEVGGRIWDFETKGTTEFLDSFKTQRAIPLFIWISGDIFGVLLFSIMLLISKSARESAEIAEKMTDNFNLEKKKVIKKQEEIVSALRESEKNKKAFSRMNGLMVGRELKMLDLKKKNVDLKAKLDNK